MAAEPTLDKINGPDASSPAVVLSRAATGWIGLLLTAAIVAVLASRTPDRPPASTPVPAISFQLSDGS